MGEHSTYCRGGQLLDFCSLSGGDVIFLKSRHGFERSQHVFKPCFKQIQVDELSYVKAAYNLFLFDNFVKKREVHSCHHYFIIVCNF